MGGQDGYGRDLLTYDTDSDTLMAGVHVKPTERFGLGLHFSWTESEAGLRQFQIDGGEYLDTHPPVVYDFSNSHTYSALDLSRREGGVSAGYKVTLIEGLSKGVAPETTTQALEDMKAKGIIIKADLDM